MEPHPIEIERLLGHAGWVRSLAGRLVADPARADDLAQETLVAALERPPRPGPGLKPWLGAVTRKLALRRQRDRTRREERHRAAAHPGTEPATDEQAADRELRALVGSAVAELEEPYRTTVMLRYFGGFSSAEIARREGLPEGTVRSRLSRALDRLRSELDERHGGREVWSCAVLGLLAPERILIDGAAGAAAVEGLLTLKVLAMKAVLGTVAAAAVLAIGWVGFTQLGSRPGAGAAERTSDLSRPAVQAVAPPLVDAPVEAPVAPSAGGRRAAAPVEETPAPTAPEAEPAPARTASVEARLIDRDGVPLSTGRMTLDAATVRAGIDGRARLEHELPRGEQSLEVRFDAPGLATRFVRARLQPGATVQLGEVQLGPAGVIRGRVEDELGRPFAEARVFATGVDELQADPDQIRRHGPTLDLSVVETLTAGDGSFLLEGVAAGFVKLWANAEGCGFASEGPFEVLPQAALDDVRIVLAELRDDDRIEGVVLSPEGEPLPGVYVSYSFRFANSSTVAGEMTDDQGAFSLTLAHRVPYHFSVRDPEDRWPAIDAPDVQPGTSDLVLRFVETREIEVVVRATSAGPVEDFEVRLEPSRRTATPGAHHGALVRAARTAHPGGVAEVRLPTQEFELVVDATGYELERLGPFAPESVPDSVEVLLTALPGIHGVVLAKGRPAAGAEVGLRALVDDETLQLVNGFRSVVDSYDLLSTVSDASGRFHLYPRTDGEYLLRVEQPGFATAELGPLAIDATVRREGLEVVLGAGGAIEGCVLAPGGEDPAGVIVGLNHGDGHPRTLRADADGCYRFEGLTPGFWELTARAEELSPNQTTSSVGPNASGEPMTWSCEVFEGETTHFDLDLRGVEAPRLRGVLSLGEVPAVGWTASVRRTDQFQDHALSSALTSAEGGFELEVSEPGVYQLLLRAPSDLELEFDVELVEGTNPWAETLALAELAGQGALGELQLDQTLEYVAERTDASGLPFRARAVVRPDAAGRFRLPQVLAGKGKLGHYANQPGGGWRWLELGAFDVAEGELAQVSLVP